MVVVARKLAALTVVTCLTLACSRARAPEPTASTSTDAAAPTAEVTPDAAAPVTARFVAPPPEVCEASPEVHVHVGPRAPWSGAPLRVLAVTDKRVAGELVVETEAGEVLARTDVRMGGPPYHFAVEIASAPPGTVRARLRQSKCEGGVGETTRDIKVAARRPWAATKAPADVAWQVRGSWTREHENVFSAWIERLFDAPLDEAPSWAALHDVLRDPKRNILHDYLGAGEDSAHAQKIRPDCADLPYFLRAYFAFKHGLPFGLGECTRGGGGQPPSCKGLVSNLDPPAHSKPDAVGTFGIFLRTTVADRAHSGSARAPFDDPSSDFFPVPLTWDALRPGVVYADPYGHVLVVAKRIPQTADHAGILLAVDGQPDGTVSRKRFWRGNFLYANQPELGGPGFKRFRPMASARGSVVRLGDADIQKRGTWGELSHAPGKLGIEAFYDAMDDVLSPSPLDPSRAMTEILDALEEQVKARVTSIENGRKFLASGKPTATMPEGPEIFETSGAWEDFSTPSRDLRILIAIDVARGLPARVARRPERYAMPAGKAVADVQRELEAALTAELARRSVTYTRTDESKQALTLAEVVERAPQLEMAYNPNDCVELRWGADPKSPEASTCRAHAPAEQRARMAQYRAWFKERRRPARK